MLCAAVLLSGGHTSPSTRASSVETTRQLKTMATKAPRCIGTRVYAKPMTRGPSRTCDQASTPTTMASCPLGDIDDEKLGPNWVDDIMIDQGQTPERSYMFVHRETFK